MAEVCRKQYNQAFFRTDQAHRRIDPGIEHVIGAPELQPALRVRGFRPPQPKQFRIVDTRQPGRRMKVNILKSALPDDVRPARNFGVLRTACEEG